MLFYWDLQQIPANQKNISLAIEKRQLLKNKIDVITFKVIQKKESRNPRVRNTYHKQDFEEF